MTFKELESQILSLKAQLNSLREESVENPGLILETKNYEHLVDKAEMAFLKKEYLEAFLIQSCIVEGVLKNYASRKLSSIVSQTVLLKNKIDKYELAKLIDALFIAGKIEKNLYEDLDNYRKKRNKIIHDLLSYENDDKLNEELKTGYESGRHMKGFIVDDLRLEIKNGTNIQELEAQINALLKLIQAGVNFNSTVTSTASSVTPQHGYTAWQNSLVVTTGGVNIHKITFWKNGNTDDADLKNFKLFIDGRQVSSTVQLEQNAQGESYITFDINPPKKLEPGTRIMQIIADIEESARGKEFFFSLASEDDSNFSDYALSIKIDAKIVNGLTFTPRIAGVQTVV